MSRTPSLAAPSPEPARPPGLQLDEFTEPIMVLDADGGLLAANEAARALGSRLGAPLEYATGIDRLLANVQLVNGGGSPAWAPSAGPGGLDALVSAAESSLGGEIFELRSAVRLDPEGREMGWVVRLIEVTPLLAALRGERAASGHRDQMLKLLSHDMRTPLAAILATLKHPDLRVMPANLREIVEGAAYRALAMIDSNVRLIRAQSSDYQFSEINLCHVIEEVIDTSWSLSKEFGVKIVFKLVEEEHLIWANRGSLTEALGDLFAAFIRRSARGRVMLCTIRASVFHSKVAVTLDVQDAEDGRIVTNQTSVSNRPAPVANIDSREAGEIGALDFFRAIMSRHSGVVICEDKPGVGRSISITLLGVERELDDR